RTRTSSARWRRAGLDSARATARISGWTPPGSASSTSNTATRMSRRSRRGIFPDTLGMGCRMPIRIGQPVDHSFDEPLGLLSDCHRRIEYFLHVLLTLADQPSHTLTREQKMQAEEALWYFETAAPRHTADEE